MVLLNSSVPKTSLPLEFTSMATSTSWSPTSLRASITSVRKVSSIRSSESCSLFRSHHSETLFPQFWVRRRVCSKSLQMIGGYSSRKSAIRCEVIPITEREFEEKVLKSELPVLVEFVASWCGPCRLITPAIEWAAKEYKDKLKIMKIDCDSSPQLVDEYKVYGLPTLIVFNDGKEVPESRSEGAMTKAKLEEYLNSHLNSVTVT